MADVVLKNRYGVQQSYTGVTTVKLPNSSGEGETTFIDSSDATAVASEILSGKTAYVNGGKITGTISTKTGTDMSVSGASVTAPAGYYATAASASVASGSQGTPVATKGTVSNNSISITPSCTDTTGYITGSTKTGSAVTVSAGELVSGTHEFTANTSSAYDVTNLASVTVAIPAYDGTHTKS